MLTYDFRNKEDFLNDPRKENFGSIIGLEDEEYELLTEKGRIVNPKPEIENSIIQPGPCFVYNNDEFYGEMELTGAINIWLIGSHSIICNFSYGNGEPELFKVYRTLEYVDILQAKILSMADGLKHIKPGANYINSEKYKLKTRKILPDLHDIEPNKQTNCLTWQTKEKLLSTETYDSMITRYRFSEYTGAHHEPGYTADFAMISRNVCVIYLSAGTYSVSSVRFFPFRTC
jgi:hypothetical protein